MAKFVLASIAVVAIAIAGCEIKKELRIERKVETPSEQPEVAKMKTEVIEMQKKATEAESKAEQAEKAAKEAKKIADERKRFEEETISNIRTTWESYEKLVDRVDWPDHQIHGGIPLGEERKENKILLTAVRADGLTDQQRYEAELDRRAERWDKKGTKDEVNEWRPWLKKAREEMARRKKEMEATPPTFVLDAPPDDFGSIQISPDARFLRAKSKGHLRMFGHDSIWDLSQKKKLLPDSEEYKKVSWSKSKPSQVALKDHLHLEKEGKRLFSLTEKASDMLGVTVKLSADERFVIVGEHDGHLSLYRMADGKNLWSARYGTGLMLRRWQVYDAAELRLSGDWLGDIDIAHSNGVVTIATYGGRNNPADMDKYNPTGTVKAWVIKVAQK